MARRNTTQLNIRSEFARSRAQELADRTGMTATQVVEEALKAFEPEPRPVGRLVRKGRLLVITGGPEITVEDVQRSIDEAREERMDDILRC